MRGSERCSTSAAPTISSPSNQPTDWARHSFLTSAQAGVWRRLAEGWDRSQARCSAAVMSRTEMGAFTLAHATRARRVTRHASPAGRHTPSADPPARAGPTEDVCRVAQAQPMVRGSGGSRGLSRWATRAVHPVWCVAPRPSPVSPSKYSEKVGCADHSGSGEDSMRLPSDGRRPSTGRKSAVRPPSMTSAASSSVRQSPEPVGISMRKSSPK